MELAGNYASDAVDRAWQQIAADLTDAYPGCTVTYGLLGFTAVLGGVTIGPASWAGIKALLDVAAPPARQRLAPPVPPGEHDD